MLFENNGGQKRDSFVTFTNHVPKQILNSLVFIVGFVLNTKNENLSSLF
jgi:hypothetical protein